MRRTFNASVLLASSLMTLASLSSGCSVLKSLGLNPRADKAEVADVGPLPTATCEAHWREHPQAPVALPQASAEAKVVDALCWPMPRNDPRQGASEARQARVSLSASKRPYVQGHFAFDDRNFDPLQASLLVTGCIDHGTCEAKRSYVVGQMATYAERATPQEVERAVAGLDLSPQVRDAYLAHYTGARTEVLSLAEAIPEKDVEVCRELPRQVRQRRIDDYETFAEHYTRFDALWTRLAGVMDGQAGDASLLSEAVALRDEHVAACFERGTLDPKLCWHATPARPLTEAIARMAVRQGDAARATVEHETLESGRDLFSVANEISYSQSRWFSEKRTTRNYTAWDLVPSVPHDPALDTDVGKLSQGIEWVSAKVEAVDVSGAEATIRLQTKVTERTDKICKETNKIDRVDNGKVYYKRKCRNGKTHVTRTPYEPVMVPATDVPHLAKDLRVRVAVDPASRRGHVLEVVSEKSNFQGKYTRKHLRFTPLSREG